MGTDRPRAWNSTLPAPSKPMERGTPIAKRNKARARQRQADHFGPRAAWTRTLPCLICGVTPSQACHAKSRGAGGTADHLVAMCPKHHREQHAMGIETFQRTYGVDLLKEAERYGREWEDHQRRSA